MADDFSFDRADFQRNQCNQDGGCKTRCSSESGKEKIQSDPSANPFAASYLYYPNSSDTQTQQSTKWESQGVKPKVKTSSFFHSKSFSPKLQERRRVEETGFGSLPTSDSASQSQQQLTFLDRFRSRASSSPKHSYMRRPSGRSTLTNPVDFSASVGYSGSPGSSSNYSEIVFPTSNRFNEGSSDSLPASRSSSKQRKWYSFTNLLNRSNLKEILTLPRSRLSVSSIFTRSDSDVTPTEPSPGFSGGFPLFRTNGGAPEYFDTTLHQPSSPTPSCVTISGEFPSRLPHPGTGGVSFANNVVFRKPRYNQRSASASAASGVTFNNNSAYSSYPATASGDSRTSIYRGTNSLNYNNKSRSRLSCGEFFPGPVPSSPGFLGPDFQFHFYYSTRNTGNGSGKYAGENTNGNSKRTLGLGRSLPTLLGNPWFPYDSIHSFIHQKSTELVF